MTSKGALDQDKCNNMMNHLKSSHFIFGKDESGFKFSASSSVGKSAQTARSAERPPWATLQTHYNVGKDNENKTSDYSMRFQKANSNPNSTNAAEHIANKTKIEQDSTTITNPKVPIKEETSTGSQYPAKDT